jgi:hypothetical protein
MHPALALVFKPCATPCMKLGIRVGRVDQHIGIDDQQSLAFLGLKQCRAVRNIDKSTAAAQFRQSRDHRPLWFGP